MAYELTGFRTLVIKNGLSGTPQAVSGTPPMWQSSESLILANIEASTNSGYSAYWWDTDPMNNIRMRYGEGGISIAQYVANVMAIGNKAYLYNPEIGDSFALIIYKDTNTSAMIGARMGGSDVAGYYTIQGVGAACDDREGIMMSPWVCLGFAKDPDTGKANVFNLNILSNWNAASFNWQTYSTAVLPAISQVCQIILLNNAPVPPTPPSTDPYEAHNNNYDTPIGGEGGYDETSDTIAEAAMPTIGGNTSGFCTAYVPTLSQINALANRLADPTVYQVLGNTILKIDDIIIGLSIFPFTVPKIAATHQLRVNLVGVYVPAGVYLDKADGQYHEINCGFLDVEEFWGNCLDYNPYTKVSIYLPFCGFYELDTDDVMNKTIQVKYRIDIMTGTCLASIIVDGSVMYQYAGQCSSQIPISSVSFDSFMQSVISVGVATATGGAGLAAAGASAALGDARANMAGMSHADVSQYQHESVRANFHKTVVDTQSSIQSATAGAIMSAKGQYKHAGAMTGIAGFMGAKKPYLIIKRPNQAIPSDYGHFHGYPSNTKAVLGDLEGYTVVDDIRLNIPEATVEEIIECEKLLKGGIII